jgi:hypothetical protein
MRRKGAWRVRRTLTVVLAIAPCLSPRVVAVEAPEDLPKVEFVEVYGQPCLQPVVNASHVVLADFRAAESRWLARWRPDAGKPREIELTMHVREASGGEPETVTTQRETVHLDDVDGPSATVCFDINLKETKTRHEE